MSEAYYSLYCKQQELESWWHTPWACGFASLVTCFRILGDRTTEDSEIVARFREFGGIPHDGMTTDEAVSLGRSFGYRTLRNPVSTRRGKVNFVEWMRKKWDCGHPVMLSVDSHCDQGVANHWVVVYGDSGQSKVWVMDPIEKGEPFSLFSVADLMKFAACDDGTGFIEYDGVAVSAIGSSGLNGVPPSAALIGFLNEDFEHSTGWASQRLAAALIDNHFSSIAGIASQGKAEGRDAVTVNALLDKDGPVVAVVEDWSAFFSETQEENIESLRAVLHDVEAHKCHTVAVSELDHMTREMALNLILIGTNLMDS